jgi:ribonuclease J
MGLIPELYGVYRSDLLENIGEEVHHIPTINGVVLSHSHLDHCGYVSFLDNKIPVYCSFETKASIEAYEDISRRSLETEMTSHTLKGGEEENIIQPIGKFHISHGEIRKVNPKKYPKRLPTHEGMIIYSKITPRIPRYFITRNRFSIDDIEVELVPVDHNIPGACGCIAYTPDTAIAYTGDLRFHGLDSWKSDKFVEKAKEERVDVLITEGTRIDEEVNLTEMDFEERVERVIEEGDGLKFVLSTYRDLNRLNIFGGIAKRIDRKFVISPRTALYLAHKSLRKVVEREFGYLMPHLLVYEKGKTISRSKRSIWRYKWIELIPDEEIRSNPDEYVVHLSPHDLPKIIDFSPPERSVMIVSISEPYDEEGEIEAMKINNWCDRFNLKQYHIHSSGHMSGPDVIKMIEEIDPKVVLPIHVSLANAQWLKTKFPDKVKILEEGERFEVKSRTTILDFT